jgi:hypothetical protein
VLLESAVAPATGADGTFLAGADSEPPTVQALTTAGPADGIVRLRYEVDDAIGVRTRERITVFTRAGARVKTLHTKLARDGVTRSRAWWPGGLAEGRYRFCVVAFDEAGNASPASCARLRLT